MKVGLAIATTTLDLMARNGTPAPPTPVNTVAPSITGTTTQGQTLTGSDGTWTSSVGAITYARQWLRDGVAISGATGSTYILDAADVGALISFRVTATDANGSTVATSAAVGPVIASNIPWTPAALTTQLWLDADDAASITLNGTTVSQWSDKSGNLRHATQGTAVNQPLLVSNVMNGKPILRFYHNATVNGFNIGNGGFDGLNRYMFIVLRPSITTSLLMMVCSSTVNLQTRLNTGGWPQLTASPNVYGSGGQSTIGVTTTNPAILNYQFGNTLSIFVDGVAGFTGVTTQSASFIFNSIGFLGVLTSGFRGDIAEIVVTPLLTQADREKMEGYLAHKWEGAGAANTLAAAHPFKNTPPTI